RQAVAAEFDAVVQAKWPVLPEFDGQRQNAVAAPVRRAGHFAEGIFGRVERDLLFERQPALDRPRLLARPGADLGLLRPGRKISVSLRLGHRFHRPAYPNLPVERLPVKDQRRPGTGAELAPLLALR